MEASQQHILEKIAIVGVSIFLLLALFIVVYKTFTFLVSTNIFSKRKITQNLNNWIGKYYFILAVLIMIGIYFFDDTLMTPVMIGLFVTGFILNKYGLFSSLDESLNTVFNEDKGWFDTKVYVDPIILDEDTYIIQSKKIKSELDKASSHTEHYHKLDKELSETIGIISNINEIYKKSLQNLTTMSNNKELLKDLYNELVNRYKYFEIKYHELLQQNYSVKSDIQKVHKNDKENEELKNNLKNI